MPLPPVDLVGDIDVVGSSYGRTQITMSASADNEDDAAQEFAEWLWLNGVDRPFFVASVHGARLREKVVGAAGIALAGWDASQAWARSCRRAARDADAVVAIGGGRCLDAAKLVAAGVGVPFVAVPTQLSHDGVCSPVSVLPRVVGGMTESLEAVAPRLAFFSRPTLLRSPIASLRAGIGDLLANPFALCDWKLAADAGLEVVNDAAWHLSAEAFRLVKPLLEQPLRAEDVEADLITALAMALVTSGVAMVAAGTSRPASGAEHKISHAIDELFAGRAHHGAQVAFASLVSAALHDLDVDGLRRCLIRLELPHHPRQLGLSSQDMVRVLLRAPHTRPGRFTILENEALDEPKAQRLVCSLWPDL